MGKPTSPEKASRDEPLWLYPVLMGAMGLACFVGCGLGLSLGEDAGASRVRQQATEHNAAHWAIDPQSGKTSFVWGPAPKGDQ